MFSYFFLLTVIKIRLDSSPRLGQFLFLLHPTALSLPPSSFFPSAFLPDFVGFMSAPYFTPVETTRSSQHPQLLRQLLPSVLSRIALRCVHFSDLISPVCPCRFLSQKKFLKTIRAETSSSSSFCCCSSSSSANVVCATVALSVYRILVLVCHHSPVFTALGLWQGRVIASALITL